MGYNPADYKAVENTAKEMSKQDLEKEYVKKEEETHLYNGEAILVIIGALFFIFIIGMMGSLIGNEILKEKVENNLAELSLEVCPLLGEGYKSMELYKYHHKDANRIVCDEYNSKG